MDWLPLTLVCALALAASDAASKKFLTGYSAAELVVVRFGISAILLLPLLAWHPPQSLPPVFWAWVGTALPLEILAMATYMTVIRDSPLSLTLPYLAFTPVFAALNGWLLLGEKISVRGFAGIMLVVLGAYGLNIEHASIARWRTWFAPFAAVLRIRGSRLMLGVAMIYSVTSVLGKGAMQYMPAASFGPFYFALLGALTLAVFAWREPRALRRLGQWKLPHLAVGGLMAVMVVTHFLALERVQVAYMISVKRTSILFGIVLGAVFFGEQRLGRNLAAGGVMVAGVALIAFG
jgi:drug/metabolite transporter (DMT)-like permease